MVSSGPLAATPDYQGTRCPIETGARIDLHTDSDVIHALIYPTPPGGGWYMTQERLGHFTHLIDALDIEETIEFSFVLQNPHQYTYPTHSLTLENECQPFSRDNVTPPPPRGFRHDILVRDDRPIIRFQAGSSGLGIPEASAVTLSSFGMADAMLRMTNWFADPKSRRYRCQHPDRESPAQQGLHRSDP